MKTWWPYLQLGISEQVITLVWVRLKEAKCAIVDSSILLWQYPQKCVHIPDSLQALGTHKPTVQVISVYIAFTIQRYSLTFDDQ